MCQIFLNLSLLCRMVRSVLCFRLQSMSVFTYNGKPSGTHHPPPPHYMSIFKSLPPLWAVICHICLVFVLLL